MNFGAALDFLINRKASMTRKGWAKDNGVKTIALQTADEKSKMSEPYFFMTITVTSGEGSVVKIVPWSPSNADLLAKDWETV